MKITKILFILFLALAGFQSCYYDVEEKLYPNSGGCDTTNATLLTKVKPKLTGYCYSCHSTANTASSGAGINLEIYSNLKILVDNGKLMNSINHVSGTSPMPKGLTSKIDACDIRIIEKWVANGAKDN